MSGPTDRTGEELASAGSDIRKPRKKWFFERICGQGVMSFSLLDQSTRKAGGHFPEGAMTDAVGIF
jgi:hypothetical protein